MPSNIVLRWLKPQFKPDLAYWYHEFGIMIDQYAKRTALYFNGVEVTIKIETPRYEGVKMDNISMADPNFFDKLSKNIKHCLI